MFHHQQFSQLARALDQVPELELAVLVGSQANGSATAQSDWDIAIRWAKRTLPAEQLAFEAKLV